MWQAFLIIFRNKKSVVQKNTKNADNEEYG